MVLDSTYTIDHQSLVLKETLMTDDFINNRLSALRQCAQRLLRTCKRDALGQMIQRKPSVLDDVVGAEGRFVQGRASIQDGEYSHTVSAVFVGEEAEDRFDLDVEPQFFLQFPAQAVFRRFAIFEKSARNVPVVIEGFDAPAR